LRSEQTYNALRDAIQTGKLKPGTRLREVELAEWLGMSRTPVREALNRLESDGLIMNEPHRGMIVTELDRRMIGELYVMRQVLEGTAAALAARHASDEEIAALREIANRDKEIGDDPKRLAANNRLFHDTLYQSAHNRYLLKTLNTLRESMALLGDTTLALPGRSKTALEEHQTIIAAIERHDPVAAEEATVAHIKEAYRSRLRLLFDAEES
jgi:DNA-binding GntR family transcriptional regulator